MEFSYLSQAEKRDSRLLYELCFPEDAKAFVDYYYKEKCRDNRIAVMRNQGTIAAMAHANPFVVSLFGQKTLVHYIVAVATRPDFRRQGWMRRLFLQVLTDCYDRREPFSFLMPADPAYYKSLGYRYWERQTEWRLPERTRETVCKNKRIIAAEQKDIPQLAAWVNQILSRHFDMYIHRDAAYYERLIKEQKSEDGNVMIAWERETYDGQPRIAGSFCYSAEEGIEVREPVFERGMDAAEHRMMMGRIVHLERFVGLLRFSEPFSERILVRDDVIPENNGCFQIDIDTGKGRAVRTDSYETAKTMDIAELGRILFDKISIFINELV